MTTDPEIPAWAPRTRATYAADWALFTDWCEATVHTPLPADPATVLEFLAGCPAAAATQRRRVIAIDHHHHNATNHPQPGTDPRVRDLLGRPPTELPPIASAIRERVDTALRLLPSRGWTGGLFGQRDRCLLVLSQLARIPHRHLATLTAGDITLAAGVATIGRTRTVEAVEDPVLCGPCAIARWLQIHQVIVTKVATRAAADHLDRLKPLTGESSHVCREPFSVSDRAASGPFAGAGHPVGAPAVPAEPAVSARRVPAGPGPARGEHHRAPHVARAFRSRRGEPGTSTARSGRCRLHEGTVAGCVVSPSGRPGPPGRRGRRTRRCRATCRRPGPADH